MSGIFGIIHRNHQALDTAGLGRMRSALQHRGPDGCATWVQGSAGLGQAMLCSTAESLHEKLPWQDPDSGLVITADARIDNRDELIRQLAGEGSRADPFKRQADSQLILAAYERWGEACADHLLGDFAFAIWDAGNQRLFCARDHMGIRPFYFYKSNEVFIFASSALAVVSAGLFRAKISDSRIADYLVHGLEGVDTACTWFEDVWRLPPAHVAILSDAGFRKENYWQPDPEFELSLGSDEQYVDAFEEILTDAVAVRMRCQEPVASMLSGGLDSSTIAAIARKLQREKNGRPLATFSGISDDKETCRETAYIFQVIQRGGFDARTLGPRDVDRFNARLSQVDQVMEDPFDALWVMHKMIYLDAHERGHRAVMDGIDGDGLASLTSAYPVYLLKNGQWLTANREIRGMKQNFGDPGYPLWRYYLNALRPLLVPQTARKLKHKLIGRNHEWMYAEHFINRDFAARMNLEHRWQAYMESKNPAVHASLRHAHVARMTADYLTAGIERYGRLASQCGVEQREPLLDKRLVEFCIALPWQQKVRDGWSKFAMRRVAARVLPHDVAWRRARDQIMWKFWSAWDEINARCNDKGPGKMNKQLLLTDVLDWRGFDNASIQTGNRESVHRESVLWALSLNQWMKKNNLSRG